MRTGNYGMWTIFFDIDGTLIRTGGAGLKAMSRVMHERCGVDKLPQVPVHGRTDCGIWRDVFLNLGMNPPNDLRPFIEEYCDQLKTTLNRNDGTELPGVRPLLMQLQNRPDVVCCLLTGNARRAAHIKLETFELSQWFCSDGCELVGGFGDATACRNEVAKMAVDSARRCLPDFDLARAWVIGDTVRDIDCARSIGCKVLAVETGGSSMQQLIEGEPECAVNDLSRIDHVLEILFG